MAQPDESEAGYHDVDLRPATPIDVGAPHTFEFTFDDTALSISIDSFSQGFDLADMPKVLGAGLIRLQAHMAWMGLERLELSV
jgi:hypothetical protein